MGTGMASGEDRGRNAAQQAINSPLLEGVSIKGAKGVLININGGRSLSLYDIDQASTLIKEESGADANIIFGAVLDESLEDDVRVTVIATGFRAAADRKGKQVEESDNIVDFNESVDIERLIQEATDEYDVDPKTNVVLHGQKKQPNRMNYEIPTFMRRQAD
jgi:cell division protein FtsZ